MAGHTKALELTKGSSRRMRCRFGNVDDQQVFVPVDMTGGTATVFDEHPQLQGKVSLVSADLPNGEILVEVVLDGTEPLDTLYWFRAKVVLPAGAGTKTTAKINLVVV